MNSSFVSSWCISILALQPLLEIRRTYERQCPLDCLGNIIWSQSPVRVSFGQKREKYPSSLGVEGLKQSFAPGAIRVHLGSRALIQVGNDQRIRYRLPSLVELAHRLLEANHNGQGCRT